MKMCSCNTIIFIRNTVVLLVLLTVHSGNGEVSRDQFFPFGPTNGDQSLDTYFMAHSDLITLISPFTFFNKTHNKLSVNGFGNILLSKIGCCPDAYICDSINLGKNGPLIAPFWSFVDTDDGGLVHYRQTSIPSIISKAHDEVKQGFPYTGDLTVKSVFIATWDEVARFEYASCSDDGRRNTFQVVLLSDGRKSFVIFYYNKLTWTRSSGDAGGNCRPSENFPATAGFTAGVGHPFQHVLGNCNSDVLRLTEKSNVGEPGKWVFRVDEGIVSPSFREFTTATRTSVQEDTTQTHLSYGNETPVSESPIDVRNHTTSSVDIQTETNDSNHSVSRGGILNSIGYYYYVILVIMCMLI